MGQNWSIGIAALLAGLIIGVASTAIVVRNDDGPDVAASSPTPFVFATPSPTPVPTASATPEVSPSPSASPAATPAVTPAPTSTAPATTPRPTATTGGGGTTPTTRSPSSVNCGAEPYFCSGIERMVVVNGTLQTRSSSPPANPPGQPTWTMTSRVLDQSGGDAATGERAEVLKVDVLIKNNTNRTFVFPKVEILLDVFRDGSRIIRVPSSENRSFEMRPNTSMTATFTVRLPQSGAPPNNRTQDGTYQWQAKTWYYQR